MALVLIAFVFPLQLVASVLGFLALGLFLLLAAVAMLVPASAAAAGKLVATAVLATASRACATSSDAVQLCSTRRFAVPGAAGPERGWSCGSGFDALTLAPRAWMTRAAAISAPPARMYGMTEHYPPTACRTRASAR